MCVNGVSQGENRAGRGGGGRGGGSTPPPPPSICWGVGEHYVCIDSGLSAPVFQL